MRTRLSLITALTLTSMLALTSALAPTLTHAQAAAQTPPPGDPNDSMAQSTAREQDLTDQQARSHYVVGRAMYEAGRFAEAASEFQQAYDLSHRAQLLYNLYIAYRDSSQLVRARDALRQYLAEVTEVPNRLHLLSRLEALETQIAQEEREHAETEAELAQAEETAATAEMARQRAEAENRNLRRQRPWWPWLLVGVGVAAVGTGIGLGVDAGAQADRVRAQCTDPLTMQAECPTGPLQPVRPLDAAGGIQAQANVADALWATGTALTAAGLVLAFALNDDISTTPEGDGSDSPPPPTVSAACTSTGCMSFVQGAF